MTADKDTRFRDALAELIAQAREERAAEENKACAAPVEQSARREYAGWELLAWDALAAQIRARTTEQP